MAGWTEWLVIGSMALLVWNARKIPLLGKSLAESIRGFKQGLRGDERKTRDVTELTKEPSKEDG
jgi:TatA/E family protein of Tat protein translocase